MRTNMLTYEPPEPWRKQGPAACRVFKTHSVAGLAPWKGGASVDGIPKGAKVIFVTRSPKDTAVSSQLYLLSRPCLAARSAPHLSAGR